MSRKSPPSAIPVQPETPRLLTLRAAAAYLSCSLWAARVLVWDGTLPHIKIGRRTLIDRSDLDRFVEQQKAAA